MHICDWHLTFSTLAGAAPAPPVPAGVPPLDSINVWAALSTGSQQSPRTEVALSVHSLILGDHKLVTHQNGGGKNNWQNPEWPDGDSTPGPPCNPCLFDLSTDPLVRTSLLYI